MPGALNREKVIIALLLFALGAWSFRNYEAHRAAQAEADAKRIIREIAETRALKNLWDGKGLGAKLLRLKTELPEKRVKAYEITKRKARIRIEGIEGRYLNRFLSRLGKLPVQFTDLSITRKAERYTMECRCKW